jgi:hypothetical protein
MQEFLLSALLSRRDIVCHVVVCPCAIDENKGKQWQAVASPSWPLEANTPLKYSESLESHGIGCFCMFLVLVSVA